MPQGKGNFGVSGRLCKNGWTGLCDYTSYNVLDKELCFGSGDDCIDIKIFSGVNF